MIAFDDQIIYEGVLEDSYLVVFPVRKYKDSYYFLNGNYSVNLNHNLLSYKYDNLPFIDKRLKYDFIEQNTRLKVNYPACVDSFVMFYVVPGHSMQLLGMATPATPSGFSKSTALGFMQAINASDYIINGEYIRKAGHNLFYSYLTIPR